MSNEESQTGGRQYKYHYECKECGWSSGSKFRDSSRAFSALATHVSNGGENHIGWSEYLLKYRLHRCKGCDMPLDTTTLDRCYICRIEHKGLEQYL